VLQAEQGVKGLDTVEILDMLKAQCCILQLGIHTIVISLFVIRNYILLY